MCPSPYNKLMFPTFSRILWIPFVIGGFIMAGIIFKPLYNKYTDNPILRSVDDTNYPIENINFPAITICSNNKVNFLRVPESYFGKDDC